MTIDPTVFKAYDIRGEYGKNINENFAYLLGRGYATMRIREEGRDDLEIVVGRDMRLSSPTLHPELIRGIRETGLSVVDIGLVSTPTFYFAVANYEYDGGIIVSASHNPKQDNGFKIVRSRSVPVSGESGMYDLRDIVINQDFLPTKNLGKLTAREGVVQDLVQTQIKETMIDTTKIKPFKIVIDAANAMAIPDVEAMFANLPCELIKLNFELDGNFPAHQPDPVVDENIQLTIDAVLEHNADLGIAPDGDGDRYFFVDDKGKIVRQEILRGIMAQLTLLDYPGATVCYDIRPGKITLDLILAAGGVPSVTRVGHSLIKEQMLKEDAAFGGESSGHYFYRFDHGTFEAPVVLTLKFLVWLSEKDQPLSELIKPYQKYFHSGEINSIVDDKEATIQALIDKYSDAQQSTLDGITITYPDFWFNVRPSNTESKLRLNLEAITPEIMEKKRDEVLSVIRSSL